MLPSTADLPGALVDWTEILGKDAVLSESEAARCYGSSTARLSRYIPAALVPANTEQVAGIVKVAAAHRVPIYPISTGRNWGYGDALPASDGSVILDLSQCRRIRAMDEELGLITVEPGVTQGDVRQYLDDRHLPFMVPVTGAGPGCSLLGNALERGYSLTPNADHFLAAKALKAVLPNGDLYQGALSEHGAVTVDRAFKWGIGPYVEGLFSQGGFGVVTEMTIALARVPECMEAFYFWVDDDAGLEDAVFAAREALHACGGQLGGINLMNARRVLSMSVPYPRDERHPSAAMSPEVVAKLTKDLKLSAWFGMGAVYGTREVVAATRRRLKRTIGSRVRRLIFLRDATVEAAESAARYLPESWFRGARTTLSRVRASMTLLAGRPNEVALPLSYWKAGVPAPAADLNPARDGCGLLWYAPLVPMKPKSVRTFVDLASQTCLEFGMEPLITLSTLSDRCFDSTIPLLFDKSNADEASRAEACHQRLFERGRAEGFLPYRFGIQSMGQVLDDTMTCWRLGRTLKEAVDPHGIIAPGRYALMVDGETQHSPEAAAKAPSSRSD